MKGTVLVHGGAGVMRSLDSERGAKYQRGLADAARAGREALVAGGSALEAVVAATQAFESSGVFNAGLGSCLDEDGETTLDAALMRGSDRAAGAVGALSATHLATGVCRDLLEEGRHVLLVGEGADLRARRLGLPPLPPPPADKRETYAELKRKKVARAEELTSVGRPDDAGLATDEPPADLNHDTVGAVAVDAQGRLAAAVSTGGLWLKAKGRVGDSSIVGAGLFACDALGGAASATGVGERMIRSLTCYLACDVAGREGAKAAAERAVADLQARFGEDSGGLIVLDRQGRVGAWFNTQGMGRALARVGEDEVHVAVWPDDPFPTG